MNRSASRRSHLAAIGPCVLLAAACSASAPDSNERVQTTTEAFGVSRTGSQPMIYHGGPVMAAPKTVYHLWYGWSVGDGAIAILDDFARAVGGTNYLGVLTSYSIPGGAIQNSLSFGGEIFDSGSRGASLTSADIGTLVANAISGGQLPADPNGLYFVLTAAGVTVNDTPGACGWHTHQSVTPPAGQSVDIKYAAILNPSVNAGCLTFTPSPNQSPAADEMANILSRSRSTA